MLVPAAHLVNSMCQMGSLSSGEKGSRGHTSLCRSEELPQWRLQFLVKYFKLGCRRIILESQIFLTLGEYAFFRVCPSDFEVPCFAQRCFGQTIGWFLTPWCVT